MFVKLREHAPMFEYTNDENPRFVPKSSSAFREFRSSIYQYRVPVPRYETSSIVLLAVSCVAQRLVREFDG